MTNSQAVDLHRGKCFASADISSACSSTRGAPSCLWSSGVELAATHEAAYLDYGVVVLGGLVERRPVVSGEGNLKDSAAGTAYRLVDTKVGVRNTYASVESARAALQTWIELQRSAGEPVHEAPDGQWSDSRITVWISGPQQGQIVRLHD